MWIPSSSSNTAFMLNNPKQHLGSHFFFFFVFLWGSQVQLAAVAFCFCQNYKHSDWFHNSHTVWKRYRLQLGKVDVLDFRIEISAAQLPDKVTSFWVQKRKYFKHMRPCPHNTWYFKVILSTSKCICRLSGNGRWVGGLTYKHKDMIACQKPD